MLIVGCLMVALPFASTGLPLFFTIVVLLMLGILSTEAIVVLFAAYTGYFATRFHNFIMRNTY